MFLERCLQVDSAIFFDSTVHGKYKSYEGKLPGGNWFSSGAVMSHPAPLLGGTINWRAAIRKAIEAGFNSPFLVEHYGGDGLGVCAENREYIRRILRGRTIRT